MNPAPEAGPGSEAGDSPPEPAPEPARSPMLTIVLLVVFAVNALGLIRGLATRDVVMHEIPRFTPALFALWTASQAAAVLGAIGLWLRFRLGLYLLAVAWALAAFVDVRLGATGHAILVTGGFWLVVLFVRPVRAALR
jgi:hypothetical protein